LNTFAAVVVAAAIPILACEIRIMVDKTPSLSCQIPIFVADNPILVDNILWFWW
jgi:hypothetical protein